MSTTPQPYNSAESKERPYSARTGELYREAGNRTQELSRAVATVLQAVRPAQERADAIVNKAYIEEQLTKQREEVARAEYEASQVAQTEYGLAPTTDEIIAAEQAPVADGVLDIKEQQAKVDAIYDQV